MGSLSAAERDQLAMERFTLTRATKRALQDEAEAEDRYVRQQEVEADEVYRFRTIPRTWTPWQRFVRWIFGG